MRILAWSVALTILGVGLGWLVGRGTHPQAPLEASAGPLPGVEPEPPASQQTALFADSTPTSATAAPAAAPPPAPAPAADALAPAAEAAPPSEVLVLPHGPGRFASLQLEAAGLSQLTVYQGSMLRDGLAQPAAILRAPKIATLRGAEVRVELLHLGFDREARPIAAHVRLADGQEGIALLRVAPKGQPEVLVPLRPLPGDAGGDEGVE